MIVKELSLASRHCVQPRRCLPLCFAGANERRSSGSCEFGRNRVREQVGRGPYLTETWRMHRWLFWCNTNASIDANSLKGTRYEVANSQVVHEAACLAGPCFALTGRQSVVQTELHTIFADLCSQGSCRSMLLFTWELAGIRLVYQMKDSATQGMKGRQRSDWARKLLRGGRCWRMVSAHGRRTLRSLGQLWMLQ